VHKWAGKIGELGALRARKIGEVERNSRQREKQHQREGCSTRGRGAVPGSKNKVLAYLPTRGENGEDTW
jgi:hypothetical protein